MANILYIDLDHTLLDFKSGADRLPCDTRAMFADHLEDAPGIFTLMDPVVGAVEALKELSELYDTYIMSTATRLNPAAWNDKIEWANRHLALATETPVEERMILSRHRHLNFGAFLVDDRVANGADRFTGEVVTLGDRGAFRHWAAATSYLRHERQVHRPTAIADRPSAALSGSALEHSGIAI